MFDTSIVRAGAIAAPRRTTLIISILIHSAAIFAAVSLTVVSTQLPPEPPRQLELYRPVEAPPQPPPPKLGRPADAPLQPKQAAPAQPKQMTAPPVIPDRLPEPAQVQPTNPAQQWTPEMEVGDPDGEKDGEIGGVKDSKGNTPGAVPAQTGPLSPGTPGVTAARVIKRVDPRFPNALIKGVSQQATVVVLCVIGRDGRIRDPKIVRSTFAPFNQSVIDAVMQWEFEPGTLRGEPVDTYFELTVRFEVRR